PGLDEILWRRYERTLSASSIDFLFDYAEPNEKTTKRFLELIQTAGEFRALRPIERFATSDPKLGDIVKEQLAQILDTESYHEEGRNEADQERLRRAQIGRLCAHHRRSLHRGRRAVLDLLDLRTWHQDDGAELLRHRHGRGRR